MTYNEGNAVEIPSFDLLTLLFDSKHCLAKEDTPIHAEARDPERVITKRRARDLTKQFAHFLRHEYGIGSDGPGKDVVVAVSTGQMASACLFYGVIAADGVYSAASPMGTPSDLARQIKDGPAKLLVCSRDIVKVALAAADLAGLPRDRVLVLESHPEVKLESHDGVKACDFKRSLDWRVITDPHELEHSKVCILYSSGTTGLPKGVLVSHLNLVAEADIVIQLRRPIYEQWAKEGKPFPQRTLGHLPVAHIAGIQGYFVNQFYDGGIVYWMPSFNFDDFVRYTASLKLTNFFTVPPILMAIAKHPGVTDQFKHVRAMMTGAAPMNADLQKAASEKFPQTEIVQTWGLSETTGSATYCPPNKPVVFGSISPLMPNILLRLVDEDGNEVPDGEPGEALVKGPTISKGYHNNPMANEVGYTKDGWLKTGDVIRMEGIYPFVVDRKKELIKYKGLQVAPAELEGLIASHDAVADAGVIGVPWQDTEAPRAYVVLQPSAKGKVSAEDIEAWVASKVANYKKLRGGVALVDEVPRSPSGKILRKELRELQKKESRQSKL
ncbi:4-coumarate-CoA ligase 2a [Stachybotrys elegans]|uniref:4-coumarate-CoA ligase 2a n=1 Tax=Stachybotrys elegans TaxID=80388 RepID=A0A8K0SL67_9HYPO|nr:4-coumarate-CoA ligase 2a [Stachybotrys elegans]